ncbi:MAG TPA: FtsQ-type POTRA domain-containing protein [Chloroflexia bacterium]|nr:FtsQ-type POTRA domain-containing protein [Chloroflexia bacterium]
MSADETIKSKTDQVPVAKAATTAGAATPKPRRKAAPPPPTARQALVALGAEIREARKRARSTERVGWGLFRDDVRRGRIVDLTGLALLLAIAVSIATSSDYTVQQVVVLNSKAITGEQAARMTGILGANIFLVDPIVVAAKMRQSPFIKEAAVETTLPGQVTIRVDERRPNVVWVLIDNTPYLISDDGVIISQAPTLQGYVVVYDQDTAPGSLHLGDKLERQDVIDVAQGLFMRLPAATAVHINRMEYQVAGGVTVVTDTGQRLRFGDGSQLDLKIRVAATLLRDLRDKQQPWRTLDLRSPERVSVIK